MMSNDVHDDPVFAALHDLPACDVGRRRAQRLGARCRVVLASETRATSAAATAGSARWPHVTGIALLAVWCAVYVMEIVRRGAAVWGP
jgi:hypothetical protein